MSPCGSHRTPRVPGSEAESVPGSTFRRQSPPAFPRRCVRTRRSFCVCLGGDEDVGSPSRPLEDACSWQHRAWVGPGEWVWATWPGGAEPEAGSLEADMNRADPEGCARCRPAPAGGARESACSLVIETPLVLEHGCARARAAPRRESGQWQSALQQLPRAFRVAAQRPSQSSPKSRLTPEAHAGSESQRTARGRVANKIQGTQVPWNRR